MKIISQSKDKRKPLEQLVVSENFVVANVLSETYANSFTPRSEIIVGEDPPHDNLGYSPLIKINVDGRIGCIVELLNFKGYSIVKKGDLISVKIPRYKEKILSTHHVSLLNHQDEIGYFDRDFEKEETAIEILIKSSMGETLRKERSVDYYRFLEG